jgi:hypothetical protein
MLTGWLRNGPRRLGIHLPFGGVICAEQVKSIWIDNDWRARITTKKTLVFLSEPSDGDLHDSYTLGEGQTLERVVYDSPDAVEITRERRRDDTVVIYWRPRGPITKYALYVHQDTWIPPTPYQQSAIFTEYRCEGRTGAFAAEIVTPLAFEMAVAFKRPRWPRLTNPRALVKYAMKFLEAGAADAGAARPAITNNSKRVEWRIVGPKPGDRYVCVAFHQHGLADWEERLREGTVLGRARKLVSGLSFR